MGDNIKLKFEYKSWDIGLMVEDVDKVNLIDLLIDYWDKAEENGVACAKYPKLTYLNKTGHIVVNDDKDLLNMFSNLEGKKEIIVRVDDLDEPSYLVQAAIGLRATQKNIAEVNVGGNDKMVVTNNQPFQNPLSFTMRPKKLTPIKNRCAENASPPPIVEFANLNRLAITTILTLKKQWLIS